MRIIIQTELPLYRKLIPKVHIFYFNVVYFIQDGAKITYGHALVSLEQSNGLGLRAAGQLQNGAT